MSTKNKNEFKKDIDEIIELIQNNSDDALNKFEIHLSKLKTLGVFDPIIWTREWRLSVYKLFELIEKKSIFKYKRSIENVISTSNETEVEALYFYLSEIYIKILPIDEAIDKAKEYVNNYPSNPEFRNNLGVLYSNQCKYEKAIKNKRIAFEMHSDDLFKKNLFSSYIMFFDQLIKDENYSKGLDLCNELLDERIFQRNLIDNTYHMILISFKNRFQDYTSIKEKINEAEKKIQQIITEQTNKSQFKIIEILGFFTAIVAFIFSTLSIGKNFSFNEAIIFNISLGVILLLFVVTVNLIFSLNKIKWYDIRIFVLILLILTLLLITFKI